MARLSAGLRSRLRHYVEIQRRTETVGSDGGLTETWVTEDRRRAHIEPLKDVERTEAEHVKGMRTHRITLRHVRDLDSSHRLLFGTRVFNIDGVRNLEERGDVAEVMAVEETP